MQDYVLTDKANFPESAASATLNLAIALGVTMDFLDKLVRSVNTDPEVIGLWDVARGLQSASELFFTSEAKR